MCNFDPSKNYIKTFEGEDCIHEMLKELKKVAKKCIEELKHNNRIIMTDEDNNEFDKAMICHICDEGFDSSKKRCKVRGHDRLTGG